MSPKKPQKISHEDWLNEVLPKHKRLAPAVESLLRNMLELNNVEYLEIKSRVKTFDSCIEKIKRKSYVDLNKELTDLSGIRVITYLEDQVSLISKIISDLFDVDASNSLDRSAILGHDRIGYRSTHFVCSLGKKRDALPEYESLGNLNFEIQVRTVLQHAWAELAHDRSFKFGATLPVKIQRKLNLYSGMLEVIDSGFDEISKEIDAYKKSVEKKTVKQLAVEEIDSISLEQYLKEITSKSNIELKYSRVDNAVISETKKFGIKNISELEPIMTDEFISAFKKMCRESGAVGFLRTALLYSNPSKFLDVRTGWTALPHSVFDLLAEKYGSEEIKKLLAEKKVPVTDPSTNNLADKSTPPAPS
ncbi:MAG TPA: hypothetical protein VKT73_02370 [Xanthobacteraceae bacterium]|nr:hypothetical protein [Xanthobacteraceae bacterium]